MFRVFRRNYIVEEYMTKDRYAVAGLCDPHLWEQLGDGWLLGRSTGLLYHYHEDNTESSESSFYYVVSPEYKCRQCGATPPAGIKFKAKFTQLNNI